MDKNVGLDSKNDILTWLRKYEGIKNFSEYDVALLLEYLEGHGYALYTNKKQLFCHGVDGKADYIESFQKIIDRVCAWNMEMITEILYKIMEEENNDMYKQEEEYLEKLLDDEEHLADINLKICFTKKNFITERSR